MGVEDTRTPHASFKFRTPWHAKLACERVEHRCQVRVIRWTPDRFDLGGPQAVTVLADEQNDSEFARACKLLSAGHRFDPPQGVLAALLEHRQNGHHQPDAITSLLDESGSYDFPAA